MHSVTGIHTLRSRNSCRTQCSPPLAGNMDWRLIPPRSTPSCRLPAARPWILRPSDFEYRERIGSGIIARGIPGWTTTCSHRQAIKPPCDLYEICSKFRRRVACPPARKRERERDESERSSLRLCHARSLLGAQEGLVHYHSGMGP